MIINIFSVDNYTSLNSQAIIITCLFLVIIVLELVGLYVTRNTRKIIKSVPCNIKFQNQQEPENVYSFEKLTIFQQFKHLDIHYGSRHV